MPFSNANIWIKVIESSGGTVYSQGGIQVKAIPVEHHDGNPAFAYRVDTNQGSVLMTGDATLSASLLNAGKGVDVLISNVAAGTAKIEDSGKIDAVLAKLMRPEQAALLFKGTTPRLAVFSHIVKKGLPGAAGDAVIMARVRKAGFSGPLYMGIDGSKITVGQKIVITPPASRATLPDLDGPSPR